MNSQPPRASQQDSAKNQEKTNREQVRTEMVNTSTFGKEAGVADMPPTTNSPTPCSFQPSRPFLESFV